MNVGRNSVLVVAMAAAGLMVEVAVAHADNIDYGTHQSACKSAAKAANASGHSGSSCFETGPGRYSLYLDD